MESHKASSLADTPPRELFGGVSDDVWLWLNTEGQRLCPALADYLPGLPDDDFQASFVGLAGDEALKHAFRLYQLFKRLYEAHSGVLDSSAAVLDFGCGWGRIARFFLREVDPSRLWGIDVNEKAVTVCKQTSRWGTYRTTSPFAPSTFPDESFDLIYAYSVFSHLSEPCHASWIMDFARILRPGGIVIVSTWSREFIERCAEMRLEPDLDSRPEPYQRVAGAFSDMDGVLEAYDAGRYCFDDVHKVYSLSPHFGETCIPEQYVRERWAKHLEIVDFIADREFDEQNLIAARSRAPS
jgi:cyclopropane fatty-acyl-phospholipid synthase-like methyltransferase